MEKILNKGEEYNFNKVEAGICPCCGSNELSYDGMDIHGESIAYPWDCLNCDATGSEWHDLKFTGHNIEIEEIGKDMGEDGMETIVETYLENMFKAIEMDRPENYDVMFNFICDDIRETADEDFSYGDVVIAFRRFIEKGN
jgi:hypothetical protein